MRIPGLIKTEPRFPEFTPTHRLDVYDAARERAGEGTIKVAEAFTDGATGRVKILDPSLKSVIEPLFKEPHLVMRRGGRNEDGTFADGSPSRLKPWRKETFEHLAGAGLAPDGLRGEIVLL